MSIEVLPQDELPPFHVVELEGEGGVDEHPLDHLVQAAGCRWRSKSVESQVAGGSLRQLEDSPEGGFEQRNT